MKQLYSYSPFGAPLPGRTYNAMEELNKTTLFNQEFVSGVDGWSTANSSTAVANSSNKLRLQTTNTASVSMSKTYTTEGGKAAGNSYTAEGWQYDSRLGRRWNVDAVYKSDRSNYSTFSNNPIIMIDPDGNDDYYNRKGEYIGSVGENTGIMRVVDSDDTFKLAQSTNEHQGRIITVDDRTINTVLAIVAATTYHVANIIFNPDKAIITAEIDYGATGGPEQSTPETKTSYDNGHNGKVLVGVVHGHPAYSKAKTTTDAYGNTRTEYTTNAHTTSPGDRKFADDNNVADYAIDAFTLQQTDYFEGTGGIHRANPDGTANNNVGTLRDEVSGKFSIAKDAIETTGGKPKK